MSVKVLLKKQDFVTFTTITCYYSTKGPNGVPPIMENRTNKKSRG